MPANHPTAVYHAPATAQQLPDPRELREQARELRECRNPADALHYAQASRGYAPLAEAMRARAVALLTAQAEDAQLAHDEADLEHFLDLHQSGMVRVAAQAIILQRAAAVKAWRDYEDAEVRLIDLTELAAQL